ncbi:hypothetical protein Godav_001308 [Gossypium davidsonii]|uniref:RNase H type-1 domain-containing protein n=1 Tax=Gossypium davidsonii TaxID=34287 RepID=A0A7J8T2L2_GOSDV|nr:hypothetical protein [Gossypium davidsonii]
METNLGSSAWLPNVGVRWFDLFDLITRRIWKNKNLFIFQKISWNSVETIKSSLSRAKQYFGVLKQYSFGLRKFDRNLDPIGNWIHLFTDGVIMLNAGWAAAGGVAYKQDGQWIAGYNRYLCKKVFIHTNNLEVVKALQGIHTIELPSALVRRIHIILQAMEQWEIKHIPRGRNQVANILAKMFLERNLALQIFAKILEEIASVVEIARRIGYLYDMINVHGIDVLGYPLQQCVTRVPVEANFYAYTIKTKEMFQALKRLGFICLFIVSSATYLMIMESHLTSCLGSPSRSRWPIFSTVVEAMRVKCKLIDGFGFPTEWSSPSKGMCLIQRSITTRGGWAQFERLRKENSNPNEWRPGDNNEVVDAVGVQSEIFTWPHGAKDDLRLMLLGYKEEPRNYFYSYCKLRLRPWL